MLFSIQWALLCLTVLSLAFAEARWHGLRSARKHSLQEDSEVAEELADLLKEREPARYTRSEELALDRHRRRRFQDTGPVDKGSSEEDESRKSEEDLAYDEGAVEQLEPVPRRRLVNRHKHRAVARSRTHLRHHHRAEFDPLDSEDNDDELWERERGKRYNVKQMSQEDYKAYLESKLQANHEHPNDYELEVREAQNSSLCNYTVIPIPDPGGRIPRELEHVKCNHVGHRCTDKGTYCCIQTYRNVEVMYQDGKSEKMKVYSGCVCSLQIYGTLEPYEPKLNLDD